MSDLHLLTDEELTYLLRQGVEPAFTHIYNHYWDKLYFTAHRLLKDPEAAEEIVQEIFITLWRKKDCLAIRSVNHYLAAMTRYAVYRHLSKEKQTRSREKTIGLKNAAAVSEIDIDSKILLEIVTELSNKLPEKCRMVFQYNKLQDKPLAEVAAELNISQKTAEAHLTKALRIIRTSVGDTSQHFVITAAVIAYLASF